jgi:hypothetical protein
MSTFRSDIKNLGSADDFQQYLSQYDPSIALWARAVTLHHTYRPDEQQWRGERTLRAIQKYYESLGWDAGPHLFIAPDGIWQLTALNEKGIHAGTANSFSWGVEVVGYFDHRDWTPELRATVYAVTATLLQWRSLLVSYDTLRGHREWGSPKTCPGTMINMDTVRSDVTALMGE